MPTDTAPLALSEDVVRAVCEPLMCASQAVDFDWRREREREVDEMIRPLVEALEWFCGNVGTEEAASFNEVRFPATVKMARAVLKLAKGE